jgi:hypothetical protein
MGSKARSASNVQLEEHLDGRRQSIVGLLELLLCVKDTGVTGDAVETANVNDRDLSLFGLFMVLEHHVLKELGLARDIHVMTVFTHAARYHCLTQESERTRSGDQGYGSSAHGPHTLLILYIGDNNRGLSLGGQGRGQRRHQGLEFGLGSSCHSESQGRGCSFENFCKDELSSESGSTKDGDVESLFRHDADC